MLSAASRMFCTAAAQSTRGEVASLLQDINKIVGACERC